MLLSDITCDAMFSWGFKVRMGLDIYAELWEFHLVILLLKKFYKVLS